MVVRYQTYTQRLTIWQFCFYLLHIPGLIRDLDPGEPLTPKDFEYTESEEFQREIANEKTHDEDGSSSLFEGDIEVSDEEQRQALMERGVPGLREVLETVFTKRRE